MKTILFGINLISILGVNMNLDNNINYEKKYNNTQINGSGTFPITQIPVDIFKRILFQLDIIQIADWKTVSSSWNEHVSAVQVNMINDQRVPFIVLLISKLTNNLICNQDACKIITKIISNPACRFLEYADFEGIQNFNNECLEKLTAHCPNLKHLLIPQSAITGAALKFLARTPHLETLNLTGCIGIERRDALKYLKNTPTLKSLDTKVVKETELFKVFEGINPSNPKKTPGNRFE